MHVFVIAAVSEDGLIGKDAGHVSTDWTSEEDKQWFWDRTKQAGAMVMGSTTFFATRKPGYPLPDRRNYVLTRDIDKIWERYQTDVTALKNNPDLVYLTATPQQVIDQAQHDVVFRAGRI